MPLFSETEKDQMLQILNLKHDLEMLGKALDEKDRRLKILYLRCKSITTITTCKVCVLKDACRVALASGQVSEGDDWYKYREE